MKKSASVPRVGIFWVDVKNPKRMIWERSVPVDEAEIWEGNKIYPGDHYSEWSEIQKLNPKWQYDEYESIPRGRIVFFADPKNMFRVYLPKRYRENKRVQAAVIKTFSLPADRVEFFFDDPHYQL